MPRSKPDSVLPITSISSNSMLAKTTHPVTAMLLSDKRTKIRSLRHYRVGKTQEYRGLKEACPPTPNGFAKFNGRVDGGYVGIVKDDVCNSSMSPHKKRKQPQVTDHQKRETRNFAADRVAIEHRLDGIKRYRFLSDRRRTHDLELWIIC